MRFIKYHLGDVFYTPLSYDAEYKIQNNGFKNNYIPDPEGLVCFGQVVYRGDRRPTIVCFYEGLYTQKDVDSVDLDEILKSEILFIKYIMPWPFQRGWWPIIGNKEVRKSIPIPAIKTYLPTGVSTPSRKYIASDYWGGGTYRSVSSKKFKHLTLSAPADSTIFEAALRQRLKVPLTGADKELLERVVEERQEDFLLHTDVAIWKIFPFLYPRNSHIPKEWD